MGKFSGFLMLCDLDDTFRCNQVPVERHAKAIRYFTENGGKFSFATGRSAPYIQEQDFFSLINAPGCLFNGGYVYDFANNAFLRKTYLDFTVGDFINTLSAMDLPIAQWHIPASSFFCVEGNNFEILSPSVLAERAMKLVIVLDRPEAAPQVLSQLPSVDLFRNCYISRSWDVGIEFTTADGTKGHALDFIKAYLGDIHTAIGVGNYYNDIPLLQHADLGVAVANAPEVVQREADLIVPACSEFGLCDLIDYLSSH